MAGEEIKRQIEAAVKAFSDGELREKAINLFNVLGYNTSRQNSFENKTWAEFKEHFIKDSFSEEKALVKEWSYVDILFQISKDEVTGELGLFDTGKVNDTIIESYLFFAIALKGESYSRTQLSNISREINKLFPMPVMILFKYNGQITLSIINRRLHKKDDSKDVLEKVTQIKDINISNPHRAHVEILYDLSFTELQKEFKLTNFVELHNAWQKTLDTKELNKRFYQELSNWYFWAMDYAKFPDDIEKDEKIRNATNLIRLITRIIFIWFIKEKGFVPEKIFNKNEAARLVKDFCKNDKSHNYYNAILQNLFFGTLNQNMKERKFAIESDDYVKNDHGVKNLYRYKDMFLVPEKDVLKLFVDVPFLNGGLFDCLDKDETETEKQKHQYIDGFSRNAQKRAKLPDFLFFADEDESDLNEIFGTKNKKYKVRGLIEILSSYKFTITENTPIEEEIALDPELLGKVFENLLASYNPETSITARKQTGSFYTPREIVNYMVDESLIAYLDQKLKDAGHEDSEEKIRDLISYSEEKHQFDKKQTDVLICAIDNCKILDPACGSGAFPMGILHKLVHVLHKLDPKNEQWKKRQIDKLKVIDDPDIRDKAIQDTEDAFEHNELDYGRKLFLIENCIYGVDIQPIAVQIAKLRFFISLIIDQKRDDKKENHGIRSLPNLETKFVAANTLIGLEKPGEDTQLGFKNPDIDKCENELKDLRHKYFTAKTRKEKLNCQKEDKRLREKISKLLINDGWGAESAKQIVAFDPYDQNASSPFFDPEWMFGVIGGFDVVIGNPPYVSAPTMVSNYTELRNSIIYSNKYKSLYQKWDLYVPFMELGLQILKNKGVFSMIVPYPLTNQNYALKLRELIINQYNLKEIVDLNGTKIFENATVSNCIPFISKSIPENACYVSKIDEFGKIQRAFVRNFTDLVQDPSTQIWNLINEKREINRQVKMNVLGDYCYISVGMVINADEKTAKGEFTKDDLISDSYDKIHCRKYIEAKDIERYMVKRIRYLEYNTDRCPEKLRRPTFRELYEKPKLIMNCLGSFCTAIDTNTFFLHNHSLYCSILWKDLDGIDNKSISASVKRYSNLSRKEMVILSKNIDLRYLLAVLNSKYASVLLTNLRAGDYHIYPEHVRNIPIPNLSKTDQKPFINLVDKILVGKEKNNDTFALEAEIDHLVYRLYNLTAEEIAKVENSAK